MFSNTPAPLLATRARNYLSSICPIHSLLSILAGKTVWSPHEAASIQSGKRLAAAMKHIYEEGGWRSGLHLGKVDQQGAKSLLCVRQGGRGQKTQDKISSRRDEAQLEMLVYNVPLSPPLPGLLGGRGGEDRVGIQQDEVDTPWQFDQRQEQCVLAIAAIFSHRQTL